MNYYVYDRPAGTVSRENPARFTWMPKEGTDKYRIEVYDPQGICRYRYEGIDINFFTPDHIMEPGEYTYTIFADGEELVQKKAFEIAKENVETPLTGRDIRYQNIGAHPRIWIGEDKIAALRETRDGERKPLWDAFLEQGVAPWMEREAVKEPERYPGDVRVIKLWRRLYMDCQEALYAVKHGVVAWRVTGEEQYLKVAKTWLLHIAAWDVEGPTARTYNDEAAFRVTTALAWGYDWLYDVLTQEEKDKVKRSLMHRARELYDYVRNQIQIHIRLLDSHGVRSLSMTLVPAALALLGEEPEAREWLDYTIEYFFTIFTPWGGEDGGWAEGPTYWQSGVSFFTEANCLIREAIGIDVFKRPFFRNTGDFILNTYCQDLRFMAFGDMSDLGDYPGMKAGYTMNILSAVTDSPNKSQYAWYFEQAKKRGKGTEQLFYNYGWWDFSFDELFFSMLFEKTPAKAPDDSLMVKYFPAIGWVCIHKDMADEDKHLAFMFKSSPYGSVSHSHGDQNAFVLHAFGQPLAIQSGYYVGFWSEMHTRWRRHTKSKNAVLVDNIGQFAQLRGTTKAEEMNGSAKSQFDQLIASNGRIEVCEERENHVYLCGDAKAAFRKTVPYLKKNKRHVLFVEEKFFVIIDEIELEQEGTVQWLLHGLNEFRLKENEFESLNNGVGLRVIFVGSEMDITQSNQFEDVDEAEVAGLAMQWHVKASTVQAREQHRIVTVLYPYREEAKEELGWSLSEELTICFGEKRIGVYAENGSYYIAEK